MVKGNLIIHQKGTRLAYKHSTVRNYASVKKGETMYVQSTQIGGEHKTQNKVFMLLILMECITGFQIFLMHNYFRF